MKKIILIFLIGTLGICTYNTRAHDNNKFCDFSSTKKILYEKELKDFLGNLFILYELENGYAIYSVENETKKFIEGSYKSNSIYSTLDKKYDLFYLGPGEYYYQKWEMIFNIRTGKVIEQNLLKIGYKLNYIDLVSNVQEIRNKNFLSHTDSNGFTVVKEDKYFRNLNNFPMNWFSECGLVAISILLGYLDTFKNDSFIPNDLFYNGRYYIDNGNKDDNGNQVYDGVNILKENLTKKIEFTYTEKNTYPLEDWPINCGMPGTNFAMRDYLMEKFIDIYLIKKEMPKDEGEVIIKNYDYPMADEELKNTMNSYLENNCSDLKNYVKTRSGNIFFTHQHPKDYIELGIPTILILQSYTNTQFKNNDKSKWHDVVAYGYKDDMFIAHMGWTPGTIWESEIILSQATIYGYYALEYIGEHAHSENIYMTHNNHIYNICGCGYKHEHIYDYTYINEKQHRANCSCGKSVTEMHEWRFITGKRIIEKPIGRYCNKCGISIRN